MGGLSALAGLGTLGPWTCQETINGRCITTTTRAMRGHQFALVAFVFMPEHLHLLVYPRAEADIEGLLCALKRPFPYRNKEILRAGRSPLLDKLTVPVKGRKAVFRFWQRGPGYDRNLKRADAVGASINYIHGNLVVRGLCDRPERWKWSSARWYLSDGRDVDEALPEIEGLPPEFLDDTSR